jgi:hypothetical protein
MTLERAIATLAVIDGKNQYCAGMGGRSGSSTPNMWQLISLIAPDKLDELKAEFERVSGDTENLLVRSRSS